MDVLRERLPAFREAFAGEARRTLASRELCPVLKVDLEVALGDMTRELHRFLKYVGPHGMSNPRPLFLSRGVELAGPGRLVGRDHLKVRLRQDGTVMDGIGFGLARRISLEALASGPLDVVFQLDENEYRGVRTLQARIKDIRPGEGAFR